MDRDETVNKAQELYEKVWGWIEWQPEDQKRGFDVIKSHSRIEVIKPPSRAALDIIVEAPDQFSVRAPRENPKRMNEREMLDLVKRWLGFAAFP